MPDISPVDLAVQLLPTLRDVAEEAGEIAMRFFRPGERTAARIWSKAGGSPVTEADVAVDTFLKIRLSATVPGAAWLSEETADDHRRLGRDLVWIVDPIDGTRAYLGGSRDWTVAIALLSAGRPILGLVDAPAHGHRYEAVAGRGAVRDGLPIAVSAATSLAGARVAGPAPLVERLARRVGPIDAVPKIPSLALRLVRVAEGAVEVGLVSRDARDWDIAGAELILREAGGVVTGLDGADPTYNGHDPVHPELVATSAALHPAVLGGMTAG